MRLEIQLEFYLHIFSHLKTNDPVWRLFDCWQRADYSQLVAIHKSKIRILHHTEKKNKDLLFFLIEGNLFLIWTCLVSILKSVLFSIFFYYKSFVFVHLYCKSLKGKYSHYFGSIKVIQINEIEEGKHYPITALLYSSYIFW